MGSTSEASTSEGTSSGGESSGGSSSGGGSSSSGEGSSSSGGESTGGEASLPEGFEDTLNEAGCADMTVFGRNPDDSIALVMHIDAELVANAALAGETYQGTHDFDEFGTFSVLVGTQVSFPVCNDVATDETVIEQDWVATAGSVEVTIVPVPNAPKFGTQGVATLQLSGIEVTYDGVTEALEDISFEDVAVGWLPG